MSKLDYLKGSDKPVTQADLALHGEIKTPMQTFRETQHIAVEKTIPAPQLSDSNQYRCLINNRLSGQALEFYKLRQVNRHL
jgi:hypothetical protein